MPRPSLESARLKLQRSQQLLDEIKADYDTRNAESRARMLQGIADDGMELEQAQLEVSPDGAWWVVRCKRAPSLPPQWGLLAGDAIHNARTRYRS
jgi:hypothetical protein